MKTKIYRTITLVLAVIMLLGIAPTFAYGVTIYVPDPVIDGTRPVSQTGLPREDWENHRYTLIPYDANIAEDQNEYIPFSSYWHYGDRTSASSKTNYTELEDGVCYFKEREGRLLDSKMNINLNNAAMATGGNAIPAYFDGNQHLKTVLADCMYTGGFFTAAPALKTVICLESAYWGDWTHNAMPGMLLYPSFPKNVTIVTGLVRGEMSIGNSNNYYTRKIFTNRYDFIEAAKPILASAHLTDRAWSMIPKEFGGQTGLDHFQYTEVSDWAKDELIKAKYLGLYTTLGVDARKDATTEYIASSIIKTYEAICRDTGKPTNYPASVPNTFGSSTAYTSLNKAYTLGIIKGNGTTRVAKDGMTYTCFESYTTREQMAAMLTRLAKACGKTLPAGTMPFTDSMSDWAVPEVSACYNAGMIKGTSATTFGAYDKMTIEQAVVLCYRAYVYLTNNA